ncbi:MAG: DUF1365 domain-containing protein [Vicinamibacteria bacterium]
MIGSWLCAGTVTHQRLEGPERRFAYPLFMLLLDLDQLPSLRLFGHERARALSFRDRDHLDASPARPLRAAVEAQLRRQGIEPPGGRILLLTLPRVFGYVFNPVSFYYCYDPLGRLVARIAEVNNTFGDRHVYAGTGDVWQDKKVMHVSPFFSMAGRYVWDLPEPDGSRVDARVDLVREGRPLLRARLTLKPEPLTDRALARALVRYPFLTLKVVAAIHFEALVLWWRGAPVFTKPAYDPEAAHEELA